MTIAQLASSPTSLGEHFDNYPHPYDCAKPQDWLNEFSKWCDSYHQKVTYDIIRSTTVWSYDPTASVFGVPVTCCKEVQDAWKQWDSHRSAMWCSLVRYGI